MFFPLCYGCATTTINMLALLLNIKFHTNKHIYKLTVETTFVTIRTYFQVLIASAAIVR